MKTNKINKVNQPLIQNPRQPRATALVLVVVLLALLAILGTSFVLTTRVERVAVQNQLAAGQINQATDSIIEVIKSTLAEDLWGRPENPSGQDDPATPKQEDVEAMNNLRLLNLPYKSNGQTDLASPTISQVGFQISPGVFGVYNEPWDAPTGYTAGATGVIKDRQEAIFHYFDGTNWQQTTPISVDGDPWLADSTLNYPLNFDPQVTNIFNLYWPGTQTTSWSLQLAADDRIFADADGNGSADSIWLVQNGFFSEDANGFPAKNGGTGDPIGVAYDLPIKSSDPNLTYRMAVRIVDTNGMVNVNTAWQLPSDLPAATNAEDQLMQFLGNTLSGVNLYGYSGSPTSNNYSYNNLFGYNSGVSQILPGRIQDPTHENLIDFQNNYIFQIENPDWTVLNTAFPNFYPLDLSDELELRYKWNRPDSGINTTLKNSFGEVNLTASVRQHLTAYSFSRNIRTNPFDGEAANFDGRMKNLDDVIYALVYRIKEGVFPGATVAEQDENRIRVQEFVRIVHEAFSADNKEANYADKLASETDNREQLKYATYHTWQHIANLIDYLDYDEEPTVLNTKDMILQTDTGLVAVDNAISFNNNGIVYGLEKHAVISEVIVRCEQYVAADLDMDTSDPADTVSGAQAIYSVYVEQYNPWNETVSSANRVGVYYITKELGKTNDMNPLAGTGIFVPPNLGDILANGASSWRYLTPVGAPLNGGNSTDYINISEAVADSASTTGYSESSHEVRLVIVTYQEDAAGTIIPEDIFVTTTTLPTASGDSVAVSFQRNYAPSVTIPSWAMMVNNVANLTITNGIGNLGLPNITNPPVVCSGYATVTTANTATRRLADVWCDTPDPNPDIAALLWHEAPTSGDYFAKIRNWGDLLAVPYVGYCRDANGEYKGIGDWLSETDNTLQFDLTENHLPTDTYYKKGYTLREELLSRYTIMNREDDGVDQLNKDNDNDPTTNFDDKDEMRLPGLININTASRDVLRALHPLAGSVATTISTSGNKPYKSAGDFISRNNTATSYDINILNLSSTNAAQDVLQQQGLFTRFANSITTRSDTFVAYILVELLDAEGKTVNQRREIVLFDRSLCNQPPLWWNPDPDNDPGTNDARWEPNPAYRPVKVVARQAVN